MESQSPNTLTEQQKQELKNMKYIFHEDPGHGWLQVPAEHLEILGVEDKITGYSYLQGKYAYLEEDLDLTTFVKAYAAATSIEMSQFVKSFETRYAEITPIRNMPHYTLSGLKKSLKPSPEVLPMRRVQNNLQAGQVKKRNR